MAVTTPINQHTRNTGGITVNKGESKSKVAIMYYSPDEDIKIEDTQLTYIFREYEFDDPTSGTPSKVKTISREATVTSEAVKQLLSFIELTKFFELKDEYGGAEGQKHYPYPIHVRDENHQKKVIYRSRPDVEERPEIFARVERQILEFAKSTIQLER
jgi:hypothetical protein